MWNARYLGERQRLCENRRQKARAGAVPFPTDPGPRKKFSHAVEPSIRGPNGTRISHDRLHSQRRSAEQSYRVQIVSSWRPDTETRHTSSDHSIDTLSDAEIAQLVSVSLEGALLAMDAQEPLRFLQLRASDGRAEMQEVLANLPRTQANDPRVRREYRKAILFQEVALDLATQIMNAIARYGKSQRMI